ncbi:PSD1 and planctomycete cytochrome C domain-containing protein [Schlesneria paludicola]|uniref:PSD1 and planctomycete cytochrome C domain-containing protein n=1 Tax=Schlesneria paludicola TaxID=360056 RepID=UPI00029A2AB3|nr:PSD1 and planctomycete cytochrome C domain-containing protein [Schlesneria paludicola]
MWHRADLPLGWAVGRLLVVLTAATVLTLDHCRGLTSVANRPKSFASNLNNTISVPVVFTKSEPLAACEICEARRRAQAERQSGEGIDSEHAATPSADVKEISLSDNQADSSVSFKHDIRPILVAHCYRCHGPGQQEGGLRFDRRESVFKPVESGAIPVIAGHLEDSALLARVTALEPDERMPRGAPPLTFEETSLLRSWIASGASWSEDSHWAFVKPQAPRPALIQERDWPNVAVDTFILQRLEADEIPHAAPADRITLIRRLSLDLIGLPPALEDVDGFLVDSAPDATERLVDRLLASPHFGEKWAIRWLDLARYADTNGFEFDAVRTIWLYRDWVIDALNRDLPFDQFTFEQVAGDLIPDGTIQQQVATGFMRCSAVAPDIITNRFDMLVDRVNTLGTAWLGLTFSCAQCHDHKFDPLTQKDFYRLYAIFNRGADEVEGVKYEGTTVAAMSPFSEMEATTLVMSDRARPNATFVKVRGSAVVDGEQVQPGVPTFLQPAKGDDDDRIGLACWLIDEDNPLTTRVAVNRVWESLFGNGLVRTSDDFGTRGEAPSHPELLDWLAVEFRRGGLSQKRLLRSIVVSATYQQSPQVSLEIRERDPLNRLCSRGPRLRVDAELIRDIALSASGLLSLQLGGPSVFPWQPHGTSEKLEFAAFQWNVNPDENRFRRGVYTHWKRTALYPSFAIFDAPNRTGTCARRGNSITPLQALVSLNDPVFFEAAVHLGKRMLEEGDGSIESALSAGFRLCVARTPSGSEISQLTQLLQEELSRLTDDGDAARQMVGDEAISQSSHLSVSKWAAYATVASVLLNLDETITKE